jgi:hypothetical protein
MLAGSVAADIHLAGLGCGVRGWFLGERMSEKPAGWYYVGDGKLRYRDDYGWTEFYLETTDPRAQSWPPPAPRTMLQQVRDEEAERSVGAKKARGIFRGRRQV